MQVGGVHEAMMVAPPPLEDAVAPPALLTLTDPAWEELQVKGTPVISVPRVSKIVGVMVFEVAVEVVTESVIDCTGQVVKYIGRLLAVPMVANRGVRPGTFAVTSTCPGSRLGTVESSVATLGTRLCQVKTPTVGVMSMPLLYAVA